MQNLIKFPYCTHGHNLTYRVNFDSKVTPSGDIGSICFVSKNSYSITCKGYLAHCFHKPRVRETAFFHAVGLTDDRLGASAGVQKHVFSNLSELGIFSEKKPLLMKISGKEADTRG